MHPLRDLVLLCLGINIFLPKMKHPEYRESQNLKVSHRRFRFIGKENHQLNDIELKLFII
jgi:hypothetical protein